MKQCHSTGVSVLFIFKQNGSSDAFWTKQRVSVQQSHCPSFVLMSAGVFVSLRIALWVAPSPSLLQKLKASPYFPVCCSQITTGADRLARLNQKMWRCGQVSNVVSWFQELWALLWKKISNSVSYVFLVCSLCNSQCYGWCWALGINTSCRCRADEEMPLQTAPSSEAIWKWFMVI